MRALAALLLLLSLASAQEEEVVREITFRDAVDLGLAHNLGLKSSRLDALMARMSVEIADAAWDSTLTNVVGGGESLVPSRSQLAGAQVVDTDLFNWTLGWEKTFRSGPSLGVEWRADRTFTNSTFSTINPAYDTSLEISLTVPLLRGRGRRANEADLRASRASAQAARFELLDRAAGLIRDISDAYWLLVYLQDRVAVLEKSVAVAREIEATERRKMRPEIGRSTILDVTQAAAETKRREVAVIQGKLEVADQADELRRLILPFTGGPDDRIVLKAVDVPADVAATPDRQSLVNDALARRPDLMAAEAELRRLQEGVVKAEDALRFQLDLSASATLRGVGDDFDGSAGDTLSGEFPSGRADLTFIWPIGRRAAKADLRRSRLDVERGRIARDELVSSVIIDVRQAHRGLLTAIREIEATREEEKAARASLEGERKRLDRGSSTVLDVSRLEENLTDANLRLLQARTGLERARVELMQASGLVLGLFGIQLDDDLVPDIRTDSAAAR